MLVQTVLFVIRVKISNDNCFCQNLLVSSNVQPQVWLTNFEFVLSQWSTVQRSIFAFVLQVPAHTAATTASLQKPTDAAAPQMFASYYALASFPTPSSRDLCCFVLVGPDS